jgi:hypothetical protein
MIPDEREQKALNKLTDAISDLLSLPAASLPPLLKHIKEHGTDHEGGAMIDDATVAALEAIELAGI